MKNLPFVLLLLAAFLAPRGYATDITVTITTDENNGDTTSIANLQTTPGGTGISLREAVIAVNNSAPGPHRIILPAGIYPLTIDGATEGLSGNATMGDLDVTLSGVTIEGAGAATTTIQQTTPNDRVIEVNPNLDSGFVFTIKKVTITGGHETTGIGGGGIVCGSAGNTVAITDCIFTDNHVKDNPVTPGGSPTGGAISHVGGDLSVTNCAFDSNASEGSGGAIVFDTGGGSGTLNIVNSQFSNNTSTNGGGGAVKTTGPGASYSVVGCTFSNNQARGINARGGAIYSESGSLTVTYCGLLNNQVTAASGGGGAIGSDDASGHNITLSYCRLVGNSATTAANGMTLRGGSGSTTTAANNWWGVNSGPPVNHLVNTTAPTHWLRFTHTASPATITAGIGGTATLTASFLLDNLGSTVSTANLAALIGVPITFNNAIKGTLSAQQTAIQSSGTATATFTATALGSGGADATVDNQTVTAALTVNVLISITGTVAGQTVDDNATISPFTGVTITYNGTPAQSLTTTVTLDTAAKGAFTSASLSASGFSAAGPGTYTFTGTDADATTAIHQLVFAPTANRVPRGSTETTTFTIAVSDGANPTRSDNTTTVLTTSVNHAPTAVGDTIQRYATEGVKVSTATLLANDTDPDLDTLTITGVVSPNGNGASIYLAGTWIHYVPASGFTSSDTFTYAISDGHGGTANGTVTVNIKTDDSAALNQIGSVENLGPGNGYRVTFGGIPGRTYTIQYATSLSAPITWHTLNTATASATGTITFVDNPGAPSRFYRTVYP